MKSNPQQNDHNEQPSEEQNTSINVESPLHAAQTWMKEHKVITAIATVAVLYLIGGRRLQQLARFALKSGVTAGMASAAMGAIKNQSSSNQSDNIYH